jgi:hypothetical protein
MSRRAHSCFIALAMLALGWAQVFGLTRGYVCSCSGVAEITAYDHCHGHEGLGCHHDESPLHDHDDDHDEESTHEHDLLKDSPEAQLHSFPQLAVLTPVLVDTQDLLFSRSVVLTAPLSSHRQDSSDGSRRRWPQVLTRTIALRV